MSLNTNGENPAAKPLGFWGRLFWWTVFATSFGYVEAAVVVYVRRATGMAPGLDYPAIFAARHAIFNGAGIMAEMRRQGVLDIELGREFATLLLLFGAAWASGQTRRERLGIFGFTFAVWDLTYYMFLIIRIDFPRHLQDIDIYFLLPIAWYGPVWFPTLICMPLILAGSLWLMRSSANNKQVNENADYSSSSSSSSSSSTSSSSTSSSSPSSS